jgi:hypothetical protein
LQAGFNRLSTTSAVHTINLQKLGFERGGLIHGSFTEKTTKLTANILIQQLNKYSTVQWLSISDMMKLITIAYAQDYE